MTCTTRWIAALAAGALAGASLVGFVLDDPARYPPPARDVIVDLPGEPDVRCDVTYSTVVEIRDCEVSR